MFINKLNNKDNVLYLLAILLFNSVYLGNLIIHISILFAFIYALFFIKEINLDITDKCLIIFGLYLIVSSINKSEYLINAFYFLKYVILYFFIKFIFTKIDTKTFNRVIQTSSILIIFLIIDLNYQKITGYDIFGFQSLVGGRLTGPFKDELIPGSVLLYIGFYFIFFY